MEGVREVFWYVVVLEETVATSKYVPDSPVFLSILKPVSLVEESDQVRSI